MKVELRPSNISVFEKATCVEMEATIAQSAVSEDRP